MIPIKLKIIPSLAKVNSIRESLHANCSRHNQHIVIDYSSPNIAKPFHFGHLKSTILGNFLANLYQFYGHTLTRLNYVGDWGTQYGLLSLGLDSYNDAEKIFDATNTNKSVLEQLVSVYAAANKRGQEDEAFYEKARQRFMLMDSNQDAIQYSRWKNVRDISLKELRESYKQLGIDFDDYEYESDYAHASRKLVEDMKSKGLVKRKQSSHEAGTDQPWVVEVVKNNRVIEVPVLKSDGTSLYITRDIAAAISRRSRYNFHKLLYVAGADQERHFHCLREIVRKVAEDDWGNELIHVKIGKVVGMSSRSGDFVLLSRIIDEATERFVRSTLDIPTRKVFEDADVQMVARNLAISSLFVYDMRNKRTRNYKFEWDQVMVSNDRSGLQIQASYARLCSLIQRALEEKGITVCERLEDIDYSENSLRTDCTNDAVDLIDCLNELSTHLDAAYKDMDPYPIINHAFRLCKLTNRARRNEFLHVIKESDRKRARSRLTIFDCSRDQLEFIIKLIGLRPLRQI